MFRVWFTFSDNLKSSFWLCVGYSENWKATITILTLTWFVYFVNVVKSFTGFLFIFESEHNKTSKLTWTDDQADLSLGWTHCSFCCGSFTMNRNILQDDLQIYAEQFVT